MKANAAPGEPLLTSTAREAMVGDVVVSPRCAHELDGITDRWDLFTVDA